jgi:NADH-quinone oxidoreductase subunit J
VCLALPRRGVNPQVLGGLLAAMAGGLVILGLSYKAAEHIPNLYFYIFSVLALGGSLRVITHPRPVYAALYFILTILSSAGLYLILAAEFMAFALIIVYAGAILITYLFVIMLATQAPTEDQIEALADYDRVSREPVVATVVGFVFLGVLTTMMFRGLPEGPAVGAGEGASPDAIMASMPRRVQAALDRAGTLQTGELVAQDRASGRYLVDPAARTIVVQAPGTSGADGQRTVSFPAGLGAQNVESVGFELLRRHPATIEIAGVILLMAMLGAVVLARKQVQMDEDAKARHAERLSAATLADAGLGEGGVA